MKKLELNQMENVEGGYINACDVALGLAVSIWSVGLGVVTLGAGFLVGFGGGLLVGEVCH